MDYKIINLNLQFIGTSQAPWKKERKSSASTLALGTEAKGTPLLRAHCSHMKNGLISRKYTRGRSALEKHGIWFISLFSRYW